MKSALEDQRRFRRHTLVLPPEARALAPLDVVEWTSVRNGYEDKQFQIDMIEDLPSGCVGVSLREVDPADYDFDGGDLLPTSVGFSGRPPRLPWPKSFSVTGVSIPDADGNNRHPAIKLDWNPDVRAAGVRWKVRLAGQNDIVPQIGGADYGDEDYEYFGIEVFEGEPLEVTSGEPLVSGWFSDVTAGTTTITPVLPETAYEVKARYTPDGAWSAWLPVTTPPTYLGAVDLDALLNTRIDQAQADADAAAADAAAALAAASAAAADVATLAGDTIERPQRPPGRARRGRRRRHHRQPGAGAGRAADRLERRPDLPDLHRRPSGLLDECRVLRQRGALRGLLCRRRLHPRNHRGHHRHPARHFRRGRADAGGGPCRRVGRGLRDGRLHLGRPRRAQDPGGMEGERLGDVDAGPHARRLQRPRHVHPARARGEPRRTAGLRGSGAAPGRGGCRRGERLLRQEQRLYGCCRVQRAPDRHPRRDRGGDHRECGSGRALLGDHQRQHHDHRHLRHAGGAADRTRQHGAGGDARLSWAQLPDRRLDHRGDLGSPDHAAGADRRACARTSRSTTTPGPSSRTSCRRWSAASRPSSPAGSMPPRRRSPSRRRSGSPPTPSSPAGSARSRRGATRAAWSPTAASSARPGRAGTPPARRSPWSSTSPAGSNVASTFTTAAKSGTTAPLSTCPTPWCCAIGYSSAARTAENERYRGQGRRLCHRRLPACGRRRRQRHAPAPRPLARRRRRADRHRDQRWPCGHHLDALVALDQRAHRPGAGGDRLRADRPAAERRRGRHRLCHRRRGAEGRHPRRRPDRRHRSSSDLGQRGDRDPDRADRGGVRHAVGVRLRHEVGGRQRRPARLDLGAAAEGRVRPSAPPRRWPSRAPTAPRSRPSGSPTTSSTSTDG